MRQYNIRQNLFIRFTTVSSCAMTVHLGSWLSRIILLVTVFHAAAEPEAGDCCRRCLCSGSSLSFSSWAVKPPASPVRLERGIYCSSLRIVAVVTHSGLDGACSEKRQMSAMIILKTQPSVKAPPDGVVRMIQHVMPGSNLTAQLRINTNAPPPKKNSHTQEIICFPRSRAPRAYLVVSARDPK